MLGFLFLILLIGSIYFVLHFKKEMFIQKRQMMLLKTVNDELKDKMKSTKNPQNKINVLFIETNFSIGTIAEKCVLYSTFNTNSDVLLVLDKDTEVNIEDSAQIDNITWYEIYLNHENRLNNKGWVEEKYISPKVI